MKEIDATNYPKIPEGARANFYYKFIRLVMVISPLQEKKQNIIDSIKDGKFKMNALYAINQERDVLQIPYFLSFLHLGFRLHMLIDSAVVLST